VNNGLAELSTERMSHHWAQQSSFSKIHARTAGDEQFVSLKSSQTASLTSERLTQKHE
jgi:hypothetical protein